MRHWSGIQMFSPIHFPSGPLPEQHTRWGCNLFASSPRKEGRKVGGWVRAGVGATSAHGWLAHVFSRSLLRKYIRTHTHKTLWGPKWRQQIARITSLPLHQEANKISKNHSSQERDWYMLRFWDPTEMQSFRFLGSPIPVLPGTSQITCLTVALWN